MGRWYYDNKKTVEESTELCIFRLNRWGLLEGYCHTSLTWTRKFSGNESSASLIIDVTCEQPYVRLIYTITRYRDGSKQDYDYRIGLVKTPCHLGGVRYWFSCPQCGRRVGKLYRKPLGEMYFCRICNDLTYQSRNACCTTALGVAERQAKKLRGELKRWTYRGRPTRKVRRLQALERKMQMLSGPVMARFEKLKARIS